MKQYLDLLQDILDNGEESDDRTGTGTIKVFGRQLRFDLSKGFPVVTTKKIHLKSVIHELLWMIKGNPNAKYLIDNDVSIWNEWCEFKGDYPDQERLPGFIKIKVADFYHNYSGNYNTKGINLKTGSVDDKLRNVWVRMMKRCYSKDHHNYKFYGEKKVFVHKDWHDCSTFIKDVKFLINWKNKELNWHKYELDKDYYGANYYSKDTCVWLSSAENNLYTKTCTPFKLQYGKKEFICFSYKDAENKTGISSSTLHRWNKEGFPNCSDLAHRKYENISFKEIKRSGHEFRLLFTNGNLGKIYPKQWRNVNGIDQLQNAIDTIRNNPTSRRIIVSSWNPAEIDEMALPPCHCFFQFNVRGNKLDLQLYQRSADAFLGVPFNITSYALLLEMVALITGKKAGEFIHTFGDVHIYKNHIEQVKEQLTREPYPLPTVHFDLKLSENKFIEEIDDFTYDSIMIKDYIYHPRIKAEVSV